MGFNESGEYKITFIDSGVGTGSVQVLQGVEFEVEPYEDHTFDVEPHGNVNHVVEDGNEAAFAVTAVEKIYVHESLTFNNTVACEVISKWKAGLKEDMDVRSDVYVISNSCRKAVTTATAITGSMQQAEIWGTKDLLVKAKGNVLGMEIIRDQSGTVMWKRMASGHIYAVGSQEYQMVCTRPDIASTSVDMLDGFDRGLQTNVQVIVHFDYDMGRSITVMSRSITGYGLMILGCVVSLKANMQHMEVLSTTEVGYMTFTKARKKKIWLKGLLTKSGYKLRLVAGIATGALVKGCSWSEVPAQVKMKSLDAHLLLQTWFSDEE
ncbi:hypothetical protein Tco_1411916, partial [Tanacetum coccineum]